MMKSGAPPDKVGVLHCPLPIEFHGFTSKLVISQFFRDNMGPIKDLKSGNMFAYHYKNIIHNIFQVADMCCFLCSESGIQMTEASIMMDGGWTAR